MKFKATLKAPRLDLSAYRERVRECLTEALSHALFDWLLATAETAIPVWSGASKATFLELASHIRFALLIDPVVPSRIPLGIANSEAEFLPSAEVGRGRYTFTYHTTLKHLIFNEYNNANHYGFHLKRPGPYHFQEKGRASFRWMAEFVRLPNPFDAEKVTTYKVQ